LSRPDGDDANPWPDEADAGIPVARDKLGRPESAASPFEPVTGVMTAVAGLVGDELMCRCEEICCNDGSRVIRGLSYQSCIYLDIREYLRGRLDYIDRQRWRWHF
jgi:hypothetical protein